MNTCKNLADRHFEAIANALAWVAQARLEAKAIPERFTLRVVAQLKRVKKELEQTRSEENKRKPPHERQKPKPPRLDRISVATIKRGLRRKSKTPDGGQSKYPTISEDWI